MCKQPKPFDGTTLILSRSECGSNIVSGICSNKFVRHCRCVAKSVASSGLAQGPDIWHANIIHQSLLGAISPRGRSEVALSEQRKGHTLRHTTTIRARHCAMQFYTVTRILYLKPLTCWRNTVDLLQGYLGMESSGSSRES